MKELQFKPKNVEEAIKAGWKTAEEIYECSGVCRDTFNVFFCQQLEKLHPRNQILAV